MFDLLVFVTKVTLTKLALHSLFVSEDTFFASSFSFQSSSAPVLATQLEYQV
ncbi:Hypothetical protein Eab7_0008 [Exiguobacterium antarcticum B7]|nr:Hypothetical protein Eab7_0008 [Exiguobacterium antarcticum B7]